VSAATPSLVSGADAAVELGVPEGSLLAARAADAKQGARTVVLGMAELIGVTDAFVITSGRNPRQVRTIVEEVERQLATATGRRPIAVEGLGELTWVLMDYGEFVVHVFTDDTREHYALERLWGDAPRIDWARPSRPSG
jgi:ribosome-associated protein